MRSPSLLVQPISGFVPFSSGGTIAGELDETPAPARVAPAMQPTAPAPHPATPELAGMRQATWHGSAVGVRRVEAAVLIAVCGYFTFGLGKLFGLL